MAHRITEACNGCSACYRQCPTAAIFGEFPVRYAIEPSECIDCGVCGWVCPVDAVVDATGAVVPRVARDIRPKPVFSADDCNGCRSCVDICPFECLVIIGRPHEGLATLAVPGRCVGCGECARSCSKGAIAMRSFDARDYDPDEDVRRLRAFLADAQ